MQSTDDLPRRKFKRIAKRVLSKFFSDCGLVELFAKKISMPWKILMYHRVVDPDGLDCPIEPGMYVQPETFFRHMDYLATNCNVIPLEQLVKAIDAKEKIAEKTVAITFDDGWVDNFSTAFPSLKEHGLPATIFLATSFVGTNGTFWTNSLALALHRLQQKRAKIEGFLKQSFVSPKIADLISAIIFCTDKAQANEKLSSLLTHMKNLPSKEQDVVLQALCELAEVDTDVAAKRSFLSWAEIQEMSRHNISFGCHSHSHANLTELSEGELRTDINSSLAAFSAHNIKPSSVFCYPGGYFNEKTQACLQTLGFRYCLAASSYTPKAPTTPTMLGRVSIHEDISNTCETYACRIWMGL
ncbi:MAG: polysaccharide deacetylase family protein [Deltaproteobacteria bacterium]|nr:polysaccharide deacetylase family protein [Deltaproteobacteria bacterium]